MFRVMRSAKRLADRPWTILALVMTLVLSMVLAGCAGGAATSQQDQGEQSDLTSSAAPITTNDGKTQQYKPAEGTATATLRIASGSENKEVSAAIQHAVDESKVAVTIDYMGSLDMMNVLKSGGQQYDAVWPASSMWITMGDTKHLVKDAQSTSTTPVVFGVAKSKAEQLGWADDTGATKAIQTQDIIDAVKAGKFTFSMTSATQSNSGASAYLALLTAIAGTDQAVTTSNLNDTKVREGVQTLLSGVDRSSGSSDWLKDMVVSNPDRFDAMVNYESLIIQANKALEKKGKEPLLAVYPADGIALSDSPLGYVDRGQDADQAFDAFSKALRTSDAKLLFERAGRRTGLGGTLTNKDDAQVKQTFRADWGISTGANTLKTIPMPAASVITEALDVYQTVLRKPSWTIWVVDYSGSMVGDGKDGVIRGLNAALNPEQAKQSHIEPGTKDVNVFIPFSGPSSASVEAQSVGSDTGELLKQAKAKPADGGTDIYQGLEVALDHLPDDPADYTTAIVLMTDGQSMTGNKQSLTQQYKSDGRNVPIFSIMFGDADPQQLDDLAKLSNAKVFDGRNEDLAKIFREVKGFN